MKLVDGSYQAVTKVDEGKPHVRFCEGHSKSIAPANAGDKVRFRYVYSTIQQKTVALIKKGIIIR